MLELFDNISEETFEILTEQFDIEWKDYVKNNKNSIISFGKKINPIFCLKQIPMGNIDFILNEHFPLNDEEGEHTCWRELHVMKTLQSVHKKHGSKNFVHYHTSFIKNKNERPHLCILLTYVPFTMYDMIHLYPYQTRDVLFFIIQLYFVALYMNNEDIIHNDLHYHNILVDIPDKPTDLYFFNKSQKYKLSQQDKIYSVIDYGVAEIDNKKSNFQEWKNFFLYFETNINVPFSFKYINSFEQFFTQIQQFQLLEKC